MDKSKLIKLYAEKKQQRDYEIDRVRETLKDILDTEIKGKPLQIEKTENFM